MKTNSTWLLKSINIVLTIFWYANILFIIIGFTLLTINALNSKFGTGTLNNFSDISVPVRYKVNHPIINLEPLSPNATHITIQEDQSLLKLKLKTTWRNVATSYFFFIALEMLTMTIIYQLRKFFNTIKQNAPFSYENIRRLKLVALCFMLLTVLHILLGLAQKFMIEDNVKNFKDIHLVWSENFIGIILGATIYIMADVFKYGFNLQKENEEFV